MAGNTSIWDLLLLQTDEINMLRSMFPQKGEFVLDDEDVIEEMLSCIKLKNCEALEKRLGFTLKLQFCEKEFEMVCQLPHRYPELPPNLFFRCECLSRQNYRLLTDSLTVSVISPNEPCLISIVQWLQQKAPDFLEKEAIADDFVQPVTDTKFCKMWLSVHHIYSKYVRTNILQLSKQFQLTGFSMCGKPGLLYVEGYESGVREIYLLIRKVLVLNQVVLREYETFEVKDSEEVEVLRKFKSFEEKDFKPKCSATTGRKSLCSHSDRGQLFRFLEDIGFGHMFPILFGLEGKSSE